MYWLGLFQCMGQKRNSAQIGLNKQQGIYRFACETRIELKCCFMPTWMQVGVLIVMCILTHILLCYMQLPLIQLVASSHQQLLRYFLPALQPQWEERSLNNCKSPCFGYVCCILNQSLWFGQGRGVRGLGGHSVPVGQDWVKCPERTGRCGWGVMRSVPPEPHRVWERCHSANENGGILIERKKQFRAGRNRYLLHGRML